MFVSAYLTSLPLPFEEAVRAAAALGFGHVDVVALTQRPASHLDALAEAGVVVSCAGLGVGLPEGQTLDAEDAGARRAALETVRLQIADAARLGATHGYVVPGRDATPAGLERFQEACVLLADFAAGRMVRLCVEHVPGRALPTAAGALAWLDEVGHDNLALLLDLGHCLISGEDATEVVARAGRILGYVHCDDNDGAGDLHWPLLTGRLTEEGLRRALGALRAAGYDGALTLELSPKSGDPRAALRDGKELLGRLLAFRET